MIFFLTERLLKDFGLLLFNVCSSGGPWFSIPTSPCICLPLFWHMVTDYHTARVHPRSGFEKNSRTSIMMHVLWKHFLFSFMHLHIQVSAATSNEELVAVMCSDEALSKITEAGYTKPEKSAVATHADKQEIKSLLTTYNLFIEAKAMMDQFKEGLEAFRVHDFFTRHVDLLRPLLVDERTPLKSSKCTP